MNPARVHRACDCPPIRRVALHVQSREKTVTCKRCVGVETRDRAGNERVRLCARALMLHSSLRNSLAGRNGRVAPLPGLSRETSTV